MMLILKFILAFSIIFLVPGYVFVLMLFPNDAEINQVEFFFFVILTSTAISSLTAFGLLAANLQLNPINFLFCIFAMIIMLFLVVQIRSGFKKIFELNRFLLLDKLRSIFNLTWVTLLIVICLTIIAANYLIPFNPTRITEFYISPTWLDNGSGRILMAETVVSVPVEINNLEKLPLHYNIEAVLDDVVIWESGDILLDHGTVAKYEIPVLPYSTDSTHQIVINLYRNSSETIFATLRLEIPAQKD